MSSSASGGGGGGSVPPPQNAPVATEPNRLLPASRLRNSYYALRHGRSLANVGGIISSDPEIATVTHGLSEEGWDQARAAGDRIALEFISASSSSSSSSAGDGAPLKGVAIYSSDFTRARETASCVADALRQRSTPLYRAESDIDGNGVILETRLRERSFGDLSGGPDSRYGEVWDLDATDADHEEMGVESVNSVLERTSGLILDIEREMGGGSTMSSTSQPWMCVLVAHGDVLQIMQAGFRKMDGSLHRTLPHLDTATEREMKLFEISDSE